MVKKIIGKKIKNAKLSKSNKNKTSHKRDKLRSKPKHRTKRLKGGFFFRKKIFLAWNRWNRGTFWRNPL